MERAHKNYLFTSWNVLFGNWSDQALNIMQYHCCNMAVMIPPTNNVDSWNLEGRIIVSCNNSIISVTTTTTIIIISIKCGSDITLLHRWWTSLRTITMVKPLFMPWYNNNKYQQQSTNTAAPLWKLSKWFSSSCTVHAFVASKNYKSLTLLLYRIDSMRAQFKF